MEKTPEMLEEEELMKKIMGFTQFDSTKVHMYGHRVQCLYTVQGAH